MKAVTLAVVSFRFGELERPVLVIDSGLDRHGREQVVVRIRSGEDMRLTLHQKADGTVLCNFQSADKPASVWDEDVRRIAQAQGWDGEQHLRYYFQQELHQIEGMNGHEMVTQRIYLARAKQRARYGRERTLRLEAPGPEFMLTLRLSTASKKCQCVDDSSHVTTWFGDLCFAMEANLGRSPRGSRAIQ